LFDAVKFINAVVNEKSSINKEDLENLKQSLNVFFYDVLGLKKPETKNQTKNQSTLEGTLSLLLELRNKARLTKDFETSDLIREELLKLNVQINDTAEGSSFKIN
jgi:cysteinyl-tRNA synthetase